MSALVNIKVDESGFSRMVTDYAAVAGKSIGAAFKYQTGLLCAELIKRTPPFSGKAISKMLAAREPGELRQAMAAARGGDPKIVLHDTKIEDMSALQVGKRRVELDIRKVIYGLRGAKQLANARKNPSPSHPEVFTSQNYQTSYADWAVLQKCQGKSALRIYATKAGDVYGIDTSLAKVDAELSDLAANHEQHRLKRGRVTRAGERDIVVGRWRWLNILVTKAATLNKYIRQKQAAVGQAKGGWAAGYMACGGRMSARGWVGKHSKSGSIEPKDPKMQGDSFHLKIINHSRWASGGDPDRIMEAAMAGRAKATAGNIRGILEGLWGSKARRMAA